MLRLFYTIKRSWQESVYERVHGRWARMYATINRKGEIRFTQHTFRVMGEPEWVQLLFDRVNLTIGLQPTHNSTVNVYRVAQRGNNRGCIIRAFGFTEEFNLRIEDTIRFTHAQIDDDRILCARVEKG